MDKDWRYEGDGHGYQWREPNPPPQPEWPKHQFPPANISADTEAEYIDLEG